MCHLGGLGRSLRRLERLGDHLPAEDAALAAGAPGAAIQVGVDLLDIEQCDQALGQLFRGETGAGGTIHARSDAAR